MEESNLDALMLTQNLHVYYSTGIQSVGICRPDHPFPQPTVIITQDYLVLARRGNPERDILGHETTWVEDFEYIRSETEIADILKKYGIRRGDRIGTELGPGMRNGLTPYNQNFIKQCRQTLVSI